MVNRVWTLLPHWWAGKQYVVQHMPLFALVWWFAPFTLTESWQFWHGPYEQPCEDLWHVQHWCIDSLEHLLSSHSSLGMSETPPKLQKCSKSQDRFWEKKTSVHFRRQKNRHHEIFKYSKQVKFARQCSLEKGGEMLFLYSSAIRRASRCTQYRECWPGKLAANPSQQRSRVRRLF